MIQEVIKESWFLIIVCGFLFGCGFNIAEQIVWTLCDVIREKLNLPLG